MRPARELVERSPEQGREGNGKRTDLQQNKGDQEEEARDRKPDGGDARKLA
jgi:hypothetical protein